MAFWPRRNSTKSENGINMHVFDQNAAKPLWCVKNYQFVTAALTALMLLHSGNIEDCLRLISVSEPRIVVNVSRHTFNMILSSNSTKDSSSLWLSVLVRKYAIILDRLRTTARGVTYYSKWSHIWDHSTKAVNCFPHTTTFPLLFAQWCISWSLGIYFAQSKVWGTKAMLQVSELNPRNFRWIHPRWPWSAHQWVRTNIWTVAIWQFLTPEVPD